MEAMEIIVYMLHMTSQENLAMDAGVIIHLNLGAIDHCQPFSTLLI